MWGGAGEYAVMGGDVWCGLGIEKMNGRGVLGVVASDLGGMGCGENMMNGLDFGLEREWGDAESGWLNVTWNGDVPQVVGNVVHGGAFRGNGKLSVFAVVVFIIKRMITAHHHHHHHHLP